MCNSGNLLRRHGASQLPCQVIGTRHLSAQLGQIPFSMALTHEYRQIRRQTSKMWIATIGRGPQRAAYSLEHLVRSLLYLCTDATYHPLRILPRVLINPLGAVAQCSCGTTQGRVHRPQMRLRMRVLGSLGAMRFKSLAQCRSSPVPTGRDASTAMPETRS